MILMIHVKLMAWCNGYKQRKTCKRNINEELMSIARHLKRVWDWCMIKDEKLLNDKSITLAVLAHFSGFCSLS